MLHEMVITISPSFENFLTLSVWWGDLRCLACAGQSHAHMTYVCFNPAKECNLGEDISRHKSKLRVPPNKETEVAK